MKRKTTQKVISVLVCCMIMISSISIGLLKASDDVKAAEVPELFTNNFYYIKNVRSGKYISLTNGSTADGTQIIQQHFTGSGSQKWQFDYYGDTGAFGGTYRICSYMNLNKAIQMESAQDVNGIFAKLATKSADVKQFFNITDVGNGAKRFFTNASCFNKVLEINGAFVVDNAKLVQYVSVENGSDQFLIEPVDVIATNGILHSEKQLTKRIMTYPNFNNYVGTNSTWYQMCNYVSQCICAGGHHYNSNWYVNKYNFYNPSSFNLYNLNDNWDISNKWYDPDEFYNYWKNTSIPTYNYTYSFITQSGTWNCHPGDVALFGYVSSDNVFHPLEMGYVNKVFTNRKNSIIMIHNTNNDGDALTINTICTSYGITGDSSRIVIINFSQY